MKTARIPDYRNGGFGHDYDTDFGRRNTLRLAAITDESAIREAKAFLGIGPQNFAADRVQ